MDRKKKEESEAAARELEELYETTAKVQSADNVLIEAASGKPKVLERLWVQQQMLAWRQSKDEIEKAVEKSLALLKEKFGCACEQHQLKACSGSFEHVLMFMFRIRSQLKHLELF